jgi:hypothetical protein
MAININLKEIFSNDSAGDISSKLNFNFNQLLALGVGQTGLQGETGSSGSAGPIGPTGLTGENGPVIWSSTSGSTSSLGASSPANSVVGDYYISDDAIYKKNTAGTDWEIITNFSNLFSAVSVAGTVSWQTGINSSAISRLIVNTRNSNGLDRITTLGTSGNYNTNFPNWKAADATSQNSQATLFNFDANTVKYYIAGSADTNGYTVTPTTNQAGSALTDEVFPYTSLLSLYSFFNSADAPTEASQYSGNIGYRHQLELGSVDELTEGLHGTAGASSTYVVSPTYQNLRIRKYRIADTGGSFGGNSVILTDFNLHAEDGVNTPALTSKMRWRVNKKTSRTNSTGSVITLTLNAGIAEASSSNSIRNSLITEVDGLHLVSSESGNGVGPFRLAIGFDSANITNATKKAIISSDSTGKVESITFAKLPITVTNASANITLATTGITSNSVTTISSTSTPGAGDDGITISSTGGGIGLYSGTSGRSIKIGGTKASPAITILNTRLASAIPFATSTGTAPTYSSTDANTLDEYQEGTFIPTVSYLFNGAPLNLLPAGTGILSADEPTISGKYGIYTKIGKLIQFTIKFSIENWYISATSALAAQAPLNAFTAYDNIDKLNVGNIAKTATDFYHYYGQEQYQIAISGIPNHWPDLNGTGQSGYGTADMHFNVSLNPRTLTNTDSCIRTFPMDYSYGAGSTASTHPFEAIDPASIYAQFNKQGSGAGATPELRLYGNRKSYFDLTSNPFAGLLGNVSGIRSNVSIYDFLTIKNPIADGNIIDVVISGSYLTGHTTAP